MTFAAVFTGVLRTQLVERDAQGFEGFAFTTFFVRLRVTKAYHSVKVTQQFRGGQLPDVVRGEPEFSEDDAVEPEVPDPLFASISFFLAPREARNSAI